MDTEGIHTPVWTADAVMGCRREAGKHAQAQAADDETSVRRYTHRRRAQEERELFRSMCIDSDRTQLGPSSKEVCACDDRRRIWSGIRIARARNVMKLARRVRPRARGIDVGRVRSRVTFSYEIPHAGGAGQR